MNSGGTLGGTGIVGNTTIIAAARWRPAIRSARSRSAATSTFNGGGSYMVEVSPIACRPHQCDRARDADRRHRAGDRAAGQLSRGQTYTILNATGGVSGTQFAGVDVTGSNLPARAIRI